MSVVIVGRNECMSRRQKNLCEECRCKAKVYPKISSDLTNIETSDLLRNTRPTAVRNTRSEHLRAKAE